jgi:autotransporter-associated beta strand protein
LAKTGAGTWVLTGNNTYTGTTTISAGTLQFAKTASLYNSTAASWTASNIIVNSGATLALNVGGTGEFSTGNVTSLLTNLGGLGGTVNNNGLQAGSFIAFDTTNASGSNFAVSNNITNSTGTGGGAIGLAKLGTGTLALSGNNTYTGSTSINAGTLEIASAGRLGGGSYSGNITNNGTFIYSGTNSQTLAGVISGSGALTQNNTAGTLSLSGTNTYTGATTVSAGTLSVLGSLSASSAITINNSGALSGNGTVGTITVNSGGSINPGAAVGTINTGGITLNGGGAYNWQLMNAGGTAGSDWDLIASTGALTIGANATNRFTINLSTVQNQAGTAGTASGFVSSQNYSWRLAEFGSAISGFDANFFTLNATGFQNSRSGNFALDVSGNFLNLLYTTSLTGYTYTAGGGSWSTTTNWDPNGTPTSASALTFNGTGGTSTNDLLSTVQSIAIASSAGSYTLAGSGNGSTITLNGGITSSSSNNQTISMGINLGADQTFQADAGNLLLSGALATSNYTLTLAGAGNVSITNTISGNGALLKSSLGRLALDGNNTYTGATTINAGTLEIASAGSLGGGSYSGDITNNGTLIYSGANSQTLAGVISGSGALTQNNSSSTLTLSGNNTYTGATTINAGTLTLSGGLSNSSVTVNGGALNQTSTGTIAGTGITFTLASGNAILSGNNTYTGATTINAGTLEIASTGRLGGGSYSGGITNNGTFIYSGSNSQTLVGVISGSGALTQNNSSSTLTLSGNNTYTGATTINAGTLQVGLSGRLGGGNYAGSITNNGTLLHFGSNNQTLAGVISGTGQLTQSGTNSTLTLSGNNTYSGITTVSGNSILNIRHNNALGGTANGTTVASGSAIQLQGSITIAGETLTLNGPGLGSSNTGALRNISGDNEWTENITIGSAATRIAADAGNLAISGNIINNAGGSLSFQGQSGSSGNITVSGIISGSGSLSTSGLAINLLTLTNNHTYTGLSTIQSGVVSINSIKDVGAGASSLGAPITTANGIIAMGTTTTGATLRYTGADTSSNRTINLAGTTGGVTLDQSGTGTLTFTSNFTATGAGSKTLTLQGSTAGIGEIAGAVINNNSTNTTSLTKNGTGTWILSGSNTYTGATTINAGTLQIGNGSSTGNLSASSSITNNGTLVFNRSGTVTQGQDFANGITGTGNLTQAGVGNLILNAANSYSGVTSITAGNLSITTASALANTSAINLANATALNYTGSADTLDRAISVTGGTGTIRNTGGLLTLSGSITKNGTTLTLAGGGSGITVSGVISGSANNSDLVIDGGTTTLTNANTYNGPTTIINSGTLNANAAGALPTSTLSSITINGGSTLALGANQSIASLNGTSGSNVNLNANTLTINGSASSTYSGGISGSGNLVKNGNGTQTLAGATTFTGTTTVNTGTLTAANANALGGTTSIDINGGSFLVTAANAVNDSAAINLKGGTLAVSGDFDEAVGALTLSANSIIDLNGFSGILRFSGLSWASGASNATLAIWNWSGTPQHGPPVNDYTNPSHVVFTIDANLTSENLAKICFYSGNGIGFVGNAFTDSFSQSGFATGTEIIAVPETETYFYAVALLAGVFVQYLRRRAKRNSLVGQPKVEPS